MVKLIHKFSDQKYTYGTVDKAYSQTTYSLFKGLIITKKIKLKPQPYPNISTKELLYTQTIIIYSNNPVLPQMTF